MSNPEQALSAVGGAVIGFFVSGGNPVGAFQGFQFGLIARTELAPDDPPGRQPPGTERANP